MKRIVSVFFVFAMALAAVPALATNGYFAHAYGTPYVGMAGAGVALPLNTIAPATNPARPATSTLFRLASAAATPTIKLAVETMPSFAPSTAARSQPARWLL